MAPTLPRAALPSSLQSSARDLPDLDRLVRAPGGLRACAYLRRRGANVVGAQSEIGEDAVGGPSRRLQRPRMRRGEKDRWRALDPRQMRGGGAERRRLTLQQRLDEGDAVRELFRLRLGEADVPGAAVPGADAEHRASIRHMVERGDRRRAHGRMPRQEIGHAERDPRPLRGARDDRRRHPRVHGIAGRVGDADHRVAVAVRAFGELLAKVERVGPEEETDLHLDPAFSSRCWTFRNAAAGTISKCLCIEKVTAVASALPGSPATPGTASRASRSR